MKLTVNKTQYVEETVEVTFPSFFKDEVGIKWIALFDESEAFRVWDSSNITELSAYNVDFLFKIESSFLSWERISEMEFRLACSVVLKKLSLPRQMVTTSELNEAY